MAGLAEQYYALIWDSVRRGASVVEEVFGSDPGFERVYENASRGTLSVAQRFFAVTCYVVRRMQL